MPKVVVTDQSFAIINSLVETFNNCTISQYLEWSFDLIFERCKKAFLNSSMPVSLYLCATHFLKNIIIKTNEILKLKKTYKAFDQETSIKVKIKELFISNFTLLQNSVNITDFNNSLRDLYYIFSSKQKDNNFKVSYERITMNIYLRGNSVLSDVSKKDEENFVFIDEFKFILPESYSGIKLNSKFEAYYKAFINRIEKSILININPSAEANEYYCPEILNIIREKLYLMPLFSGVVVFRDGPVGHFETRLTNNPSEISFNHKRNSILKICKNIYEYISLTYSRLLSKYIQFYSNISKEPSIKISLSNEKEKWQYNVANAKRESYFYGSNASFTNLNQDIISRGVMYLYFLL